MEIRHKHVSDLTSTEWRAVWRANLGDEGYMQAELSRCRDRGYPGEVIMIWNGRYLIGWALLTPCRRYGLLEVTRYVMSKSKYTVQLWVNQRYRRKGYGKMLMNEVKKYDSNPHVLPHDDASAELFSSYRVQVLALDKAWIKPGKPKVA